MIRIGTWSLTLLLGSAHALLMAALLWRARTNRSANRCLAALLLLVVLMITPYTIGYAGFYDAYPWLTFAPFFWQLGFGPLIWLYVRQLGQERPPARWQVHFVPLALQVAYFTILFTLPLALKWRWNDAVHVPYVQPLLNLLELASLSSYLAAAWRVTRRRQRWLDRHSASGEEFRLAGLRGFLLATALATAAAAVYAGVDRLVRPLSYFDEFGLYLVYTGLVYFLGLEGWRRAGLRYPRWDEAEPPLSAVTCEPVDEGACGAVEAARAPVAGPEPRDWSRLGRRVQEAVAAGEWWREPDLELAELARRLATNTHYLSRALNEGLQMSFSEFVNRQRIAAAQRALAGPGEVLQIAFDVGFRSKASFNRAFRAYSGTTPSAWRRARQGPARLDSGNPAVDIRS